MFTFALNLLRHIALFPGSNPHWRPERDMPDMTGKVVVVTGANTGCGYETAKYLLKAGAKVYCLSRTQSKGEKATKELNEMGYKGHATYVKCDLGDLKDVRKAAEEVLSKEKQIHILINNAGVMHLTYNGSSQKTAQGHEIQFGTNVLGHNHLTNILKPALVEAAANSEKGTVRIVFTSSSAHWFFYSRVLRKEWNVGDDIASKLRPSTLYGRSKLGNVHQMHAFADELEGKGIIVSAVHPGNISTELTRHLPVWQQTYQFLVLYKAYYGCITQLYAATAKDDNLQRAFLVPWAQIAPPMVSSASDPAMIKTTMQWCQEQSKGY